MGPGVYVFYGNNNNVLYVGKSKSLRNRVSSYFQSRADLIPKVRLLVSQISKIKISQTKTEFEALLVEARLIRELQPKYNSRLTDDRSPLYILVTDEEFPRVLTARKTDLGGIESRSVYGPFLSGETVRRVLKIARRMFPYCNAPRRRNDPWRHFFGTLGQEPSLTSSSPLGQTTSRVLSGSYSMTSKMVPSDRLKNYRVKPCFYRHLGLCPGVCSGEISKRQYLGIIRKLEQFLAGDFAGLKVKLETKMKAAAKKQEFETAAKARDAAEALSSLTLAGDYEDNENNRVEPADRMKSLLKLLTKLGLLVQNTQKTQKAGCPQRTRESESQSFRLSDSPNLRQSGSPSLPSVPIESFRIEGFDVSNLGGRLATAAMVVFVGGIREIGEYRHFRIMGKFTPDDPRMIAEAVERRLGHPEWGRPDLIVIDGGEPQLRAIGFVSEKVNYLGLAKNPDRLVIPVGNGFKTIRVSSRNLGFQLLQQVRDEAHRFSRKLHLELRRLSLVG